MQPNRAFGLTTSALVAALSVNTASAFDFSVAFGPGATDISKDIDIAGLQLPTLTGTGLGEVSLTGEVQMINGVLVESFPLTLPELSGTQNLRVDYDRQVVAVPGGQSVGAGLIPQISTFFPFTGDSLINGDLFGTPVSFFNPTISMPEENTLRIELEQFEIGEISMQARFGDAEISLVSDSQGAGTFSISNFPDVLPDFLNTPLVDVPFSADLNGTRMVEGIFNSTPDASNPGFVDMAVTDLILDQSVSDLILPDSPSQLNINSLTARIGVVQTSVAGFGDNNDAVAATGLGPGQRNYNDALSGFEAFDVEAFLTAEGAAQGVESEDTEPDLIDYVRFTGLTPGASYIAEMNPDITGDAFSTTLAMAHVVDGELLLEETDFFDADFSDDFFPYKPLDLIEFEADESGEATFAVFYLFPFSDDIFTDPQEVIDTGNVFNIPSGDQVYSVIVTPEPTSLALLGLGGLVFLRRRKY